MPNHATPNLPSRDFEKKCQFYGGLSFVERRGVRIAREGTS